MSYKINFENYKENFSIPAIILSDNFKQINGDYLKVILLIFKNPDKQYSINLLSKLLGLSEATIKDAIDYWISLDVLRTDDTDNRTKVINPNIVVGNKIEPKNDNMIDNQMKFLFDNAQKILPRNMTSTDVQILKHIYKDYNLPVDVILMVIAHCVKQGKDGIKIIENECMLWYNRGVNNSTKAEEFLLNKEKQSIFERQVREIFKISEINFKPYEQSCIDKWYRKFKYGKDIVQLAYERALQYIDRPTIAYTNTILANWNKKGFRTINDILESENIAKNTSNDKDININDNTHSFDLEEYEKQLRQAPSLD